MLVLGENLNLRDSSSSFHHSWLICEPPQDWDLKTFCLSQPCPFLLLSFPSLHPFPHLVWAIKIAKYWWHTSTNQLGVNNTQPHWQSHIYYPSFLLKWDLLHAGLHSLQCWKTQSMIGVQDIPRCAKGEQTHALLLSSSVHCCSCPSALVFTGLESWLFYFKNRGKNKLRHRVNRGEEKRGVTSKKASWVRLVTWFQAYWGYSVTPVILLPPELSLVIFTGVKWYIREQ